MFKRTVKIVHRLRIYFLLFSVIAFFYFLGTNPIQLGRYIGARFGDAVGLSVSVPENPFNKLALDLKEKEDRLAQMERELSVRKQALDETGPDRLIIILGATIFILFVLILLNYYLDYKRRKRDAGNKL